ncbi:AbgT family transporter [Elioraea thermophila]|nr:AbgT family transporter [Elioraea thermophila]
MQRILDAVERAGNCAPHPAMIFVYLILLVAVLSAVLGLVGASVTYWVWNPETSDYEQRTTVARSLLTVDGFRFMYTGVVANFMSSTAVGVIIVAMLGGRRRRGEGADQGLDPRPRTGGTGLGPVLTPRLHRHRLVDRGGRRLSRAHPALGGRLLQHRPTSIAGLGLGFASVAAAFLVNVLIVPVDGILTEMTNDAIALIDAERQISLTATFWFSVGSVVVLTVLIALITDRIIEPRLGPYRGEYRLEEETAGKPEAEARGPRWALWGLLGSLAFVALTTLPPGAPLRDPETGAIIGATPFMNSLIVTIALVFRVSGICYGEGSGTMTHVDQVVDAMAKSLSSLSGLLLFLFVISQSLAFPNYSNIAPLVAVSLADVLQRLDLDTLRLLIGFIVVTLLLDVIITGAIPKWAIFAPIFIPLLMRLDVPPEAVLAAYRVADSPIDAITPLNAYFALVDTFCQKYQQDAGVGTVIALMLPYLLILMAVWMAFFALWQLAGLPWGF